MDKVLFQKNLALTQTWCAKRMEEGNGEPVAGIFRSINPVVNGQKVFKIIEDTTREKPWRRYKSIEWTTEPDDELLRQLHYYQKQQKQKTGTIKADPPSEGAILAMEWDVTLHEGVCEYVSLGMIDIHDLPPIDTWVYLDEQYIYSWVPRFVISLAQIAIDVNSTASITWYDPDTGLHYEQYPF